MRALSKQLMSLSAMAALLTVLGSACRIESTSVSDDDDNDDGVAGAEESGGTGAGSLAGAGGDGTAGTGGGKATGGSAGSGGQNETTGGSDTGAAAAGSAAEAGSATAGSAAAGAAGEAGTATTPGSTSNGGAGGADETAGSAGVEAAAGAGGSSEPLICYGDAPLTLSDDPSELVELCDSLIYAAETCPDGSAGDIAAANAMCKYVAKNGRPGVFEVMYGCLGFLTTDNVCDDPDAVINCRNLAFGGACKVDELIPGTSDYTCADVEAKEQCSGEPVPVETCEGVLFGLNAPARADVIWCFECLHPVAEGETGVCVNVFADCAFPDGVGDGEYPYPEDC